MYNRKNIYRKTMKQLPNAMSGTTSDLVDGDVCRAFDHTNAIVTGGNDGPTHFHIVRGTNVNSIGVRAIPGSENMKFLKPNVLRTSDEDMDSFTIHGREASKHGIANLVNFHALNKIIPHKKKKNQFRYFIIEIFFLL